MTGDTSPYQRGRLPDGPRGETLQQVELTAELERHAENLIVSDEEPTVIVEVVAPPLQGRHTVAVAPVAERELRMRPASRLR